MRSIPAGQFKTHCLRLLDEVGASGEPLVITKRGAPVAVLSALGPEHTGDWRGGMEGTGAVLGDLVAPAAESDEWDALAP